MPFGTNCYIVASEQTRDGMVVDPAGDAPTILRSIRELDLKIGLIVATHTHPDHIGAVSPIVEYSKASFAISGGASPPDPLFSKKTAKHTLGFSEGANPTNQP